MCTSFYFSKSLFTSQVYQAVIDVVGEGATWQLEDILERKFFRRFDRGMITTCNYSCAIFLRNGLYYLYDASPCSAMGLRQSNDKGNACFIRFRNLHDLVTRWVIAIGFIHIRNVVLAK